MDQDIVIQTDHLSKAFGHKLALKDLCLTLRKGDIYGFIGKNGSGKTTAMKLILGLLEPTSGSIRLFGGDDLLASRAKIGSLIESPGLFKNCTGKENMRRFALLFGGDDKEIDDLLDFVGLSEARDKKVRAYSLGMKQRLGVAVALLGNPEVLVLDEPMNGVDPAGIKDLRDLFVKISREKGVSLLVSSHNLDELAKMATVYGILVDGALVAEERKEDILGRCGKAVSLVSETPGKALEALAPMGRASLEGNEIRLETSHSSGEVAEALVKEGIPFSSIREETIGFEDFFIERMGR